MIELIEAWVNVKTPHAEEEVAPEEFNLSSHHRIDLSKVSICSYDLFAICVEHARRAAMFAGGFCNFSLVQATPGPT